MINSSINLIELVIVILGLLLEVLKMITLWVK
nr:MAG TPA: hypothetical protein [Caudoviricetes sp.]